jgi:hypothetical protein
MMVAAAAVIVLLLPCAEAQAFVFSLSPFVLIVVPPVIVFVSFPLSPCLLSFWYVLFLFLFSLSLLYSPLFSFGSLYFFLFSSVSLFYSFCFLCFFSSPWFFFPLCSIPSLAFIARECMCFP